MLGHEISVLWAPSHPPSLNFCSSLSKAKPEAMQEIWDNTSVDPCSNLPNESIWPYLAVPTYLIELLWNFSPHLGQLNDGTFHPCLSYLASLKSIGENMILWFLNIRHSGTLFVVPHLGSTNIPFHPTLWRLNMWSSWVKKKGYNSSHVYCQAKGWSKKI
jgi:hypothetical protein